MSTESERFFAEVAKIQAHCCCHELNERECYRQRYAPRIDDCFNEDEWYDDNVCECACHAEIGDLERDIWPEDEL